MIELSHGETSQLTELEASEIGNQIEISDGEIGGRRIGSLSGIEDQLHLTMAHNYDNQVSLLQ